MSGTESREQKQLRLARELAEYLRPRLNTPVSVRLWDGSLIPLGENVEPGLEISISGPGVPGAFLRWPTAETLLRLYASGSIGYSGADLLTLIEKARVKNSRQKSRKLPLGLLFRFASAFSDRSRRIDVG